MYSILICVSMAAVLYFWRKRRCALEINNKHRRCVFVTGCDSGFGRALAKRLDGKGITVFAGCLTEDGASALMGECSSNLKTVLVDLTDHQQILDAYKTVKESIPIGKELWGLVNNAGYVGCLTPFEFLTREGFEKPLNINIIGTADVTKTFLPLIKKSRGRIVNTSSVEGFVAMSFNTAYVASKFAVYGWSEALRREKQPLGIKVSTVEPGAFKTNVCDVDNIISLRQEQWNNLPQDIKDEYGMDHHKLGIDRDRLTKMVERVSNKNLDIVVDAYEHALFAQHPRAHYLVGRDAKIAAFLSALPICVMDFVISRLPIGRQPKNIVQEHK